MSRAGRSNAALLARIGLVWLISVSIIVFVVPLHLQKSTQALPGRTDLQHSGQGSAADILPPTAQKQTNPARKKDTNYKCTPVKDRYWQRRPDREGLLQGTQTRYGFVPGAANRFLFRYHRRRLWVYGLSDPALGFTSCFSALSPLQSDNAASSAGPMAMAWQLCFSSIS